MSDAAKRSIINWAAGSFGVAALALLFTIARATWTVGSTWGSTVEKIQSIDSKLQQHIKQTEEFRGEFERRLRAIESKVGIVMFRQTQTVRIAE